MQDYIFRKYDIRGVVETDFTEPVVIDLGRAFGTYVRREGGTTIALSGDIRLTTPKLKRWFAQGMIETGVKVLIIGIVTTPVNSYNLN